MKLPTEQRGGLERPRFCTLFRGQREPWAAPAQQMEVGINVKRVVPWCAARIRTEQVKRVRIPFFTFVFTTFFTL